ncbi:MAG TPA: FKBP-type peptidyl-prolyl cis-trans isomerase [Bryobacteraceae bacterium]|nr:FKBP-type peptidyl-prolyl cis-trans isomerase [Bryobacteraceae bacterium]
MRFAPLFLLAAALASGQSFSPTMPASVPEVTGTVVEGPMLRYIDIKQGDGAPAEAGKQYTVNYTGWLRDGTQFDSSVGRDPLQFVQGRRQVIAGFDIGFDGMKVGGKRRIFIPYQLAYGEQQRGKIPPKSELIFDIELLDVKPATQPAPAADLLFLFNNLQDGVTALAKSVPAPKYTWRPTEKESTFREIFLHIAYENHTLVMCANGAPKDDINKQMQAQEKGIKETLTKEQILTKLADSFNEVKTALENARAGSLTRDVDLFGQQTTQRAVFGFLNTEMAGYLGQAIAYARMNGIPIK